MANSFHNNFVTAGKVLGYVDTAATMGEKHADKVLSAAKGLLSAEYLSTVAGGVGDVAGALPFVGVFAKVVGKIVGWVGEQEQKRTGMCLAQLCREINRIDSLTEEVARHLTNKRTEDLLKFPQPLTAQSRIARFKKRWKHFVADELTTESKKQAAADADAIIEAVAKGNTTFAAPNLAQKLIQILFPDFQVNTTSRSTSSKATITPVANPAEPSVLTAEQQLALLQRMEQTEKELQRLAMKNKRLHKKVEKLEQQNDNEVDAGNSAQLLASATSNVRAQGINAHTNARDIATHDERLQQLEMEMAQRTED